jgi:predicted NUDIX family phosphoesterase
MEEKSSLQERAEIALGRFKQDARKPIVIEFAGVPKAGKTSTITQIQGFFKRCGFRVQVVVERASVCPIKDKKHQTFNIWTACTTLAQILENTQDPPRADDPHILILDRGLFDSICWLRVMESLSRIRSVDRTRVEQFLLLPEWQRRITGVIVMTASPEDAMERDRGHLPVLQAEGSIMNKQVLPKVLDTTRSCIQQMNASFRIREVNTSANDSRNNPRATAEVVADQILNWIEDDLREEILHLPKSRISDLFSGRVSLRGRDAEPVMEVFSAAGHFKPRAQVEDDPSSVQALPIVVVRRNNGDVLRLKRSEREKTNSLHEKVVIWAGGHVRREDGTNGEAIRRGAQRELQEELRLNVESEQLKFLGAIYADPGGNTSKHVALVFEWRAQTDDVAVTLSAAEFFERRGTSLSGTFVPIAQLAEDVAKGEISEIWSAEIVREILQLMVAENQPRLF